MYHYSKFESGSISSKLGRLILIVQIFDWFEQLLIVTFNFIFSLRTLSGAQIELGAISGLGMWVGAISRRRHHTPCRPRFRCTHRFRMLPFIIQTVRAIQCYVVFENAVVSVVIFVHPWNFSKIMIVWNSKITLRFVNAVSLFQVRVRIDFFEVGTFDSYCANIWLIRTITYRNF